MLALTLFGSILILCLYIIFPPQGKVSEQAAMGGLANFVRADAFLVAPDISFMQDGQRRRLADFKGQVVLVNFWATWCAPCRHEMPQLDALGAAFKERGLVVLALSMDKGTPDQPQAFLRDLGVEHLVFAHDSSFKAAIAARVRGLPTTLLIDATGQEVGRLAGAADWSQAAAFALIEETLN